MVLKSFYFETRAESVDLHLECNEVTLRGQSEKIKMEH